MEEEEEEVEKREGERGKGWETSPQGHQSITLSSAHNTSSSGTARTSRRDEQDSQAPGALMAALIKHKI